jgi:hypothetical protein
MSDTIKKTIVTGIFVFLSLWFWIMLSPNTLHFHETTLFFPYTWTHLREALWVPGGPARYLAEFFVQFFRFAVPGGIIVTASFVLLQVLTWKLCHLFKDRKTPALYALSFIVPFCAWIYLCIFGNMFTGIVALCGTLAAACLYLAKERTWWETAMTTILLYWLCGPLSAVFVFLLLLYSIIKGKGTWNTLLAVLLWAILPFLWHLCIQYTLKELYLGADYYHEPQHWTWTYFILAFSPVLTCLVLALLPSTRKGHAKGWLFYILTVLVFALGWVGVIKNCNPSFERIFKYDKMALNQDWNGILDKAGKVPPRSLAEATAVNLALAMKDRLLTDMFLYPQPGPASLFPDYAAGYVVTLTAGESVFRAGLLNTARHYAFEEYESYPNYRVSARHMKRVAEVDLINGRYATAKRFLKDLSHTLFYRKWALRYLNDPQAVASDPEYARLQQYCDHSERLYSDSSDDDKREMLRHIVAADGQYSVPFEYLLAYDLLARDLFSLRAHLFLAGFNGDVPVLIQQAVAMFDGAFFEVAPEEQALVSESVRKEYNEFRTALLEGRNGNEIKSRFGKTYWYYYSQK